jgi:hypothetical protein
VRLIRAELLKARRRSATWILLVVALALTALIYLLIGRSIGGVGCDISFGGLDESCIVELHTVANELKRGELCAPDIRGLPLVRRWHIVGLTARPLSPAVEAFRYFVLEEGEKLLAGLFGKTGAGNMPAHALRVTNGAWPD